MTASKIAARRAVPLTIILAVIYLTMLVVPVFMAFQALSLQRDMGLVSSGEDRWMLYRTDYEYQALLSAIYRVQSGDPNAGRRDVQNAVDVLYSRNDILKNNRNLSIFRTVQAQHQAVVQGIDAAIAAIDAVLARQPQGPITAAQAQDLLAQLRPVGPVIADLVRDARTASAVDRDELTVRVAGWMRWLFIAIAALAVASLGVVSVLAHNNRQLRRATVDLVRTSQALRDSENRQRSIADSLPVLIGYADSDQRIRFVNRTGEKWMAIDAAAILGRSAEEMRALARPTAVRSDSGERDSLAQSFFGRSSRIEETLSFGDGKKRRVIVEHNPVLRDDGTVDGVVTLITDISERIAMEDRLRQGQRLEAVGQLTAGVAHDFNNLLGVILGNIELLQDRFPEGTKERKLAESAADAAERGAALTQRLLAFARRQTLRPKTTDVNKLIGDLAMLLRRTLGESVTVLNEPSADLWSCTVDPGQLESAIVNLAVNSRDAMPKGGTLTIATRNVDIGPAEAARFDVTPGHYVTVAVRDSGEGMSPETLRRAFEPFFTTKEVGKGSGLGLSMVFGFAKQSGGAVTIDSQVGCGTTVTIFLPGASGAAASVAAPGEGQATAAGRQQKILVVEDNDAMRLFSTELVSRLGYTPVPAADGEAALQALESTPDIAAIFSDVVLPGGLNGLELVRQIRQKRGNIKALFTSGYTDPSMLPGGELPAGAALLAKPFRKAELERRLAELFAA